MCSSTTLTHVCDILQHMNNVIVVVKCRQRRSFSRGSLSTKNERCCFGFLFQSTAPCFLASPAMSFDRRVTIKTSLCRANDFLWNNYRSESRNMWNACGGNQKTFQHPKNTLSVGIFKYLTTINCSPRQCENVLRRPNTWESQICSWFDSSTTPSRDPPCEM